MGTFLFLLAVLAVLFFWTKLKPEKSTWLPKSPAIRYAASPAEPEAEECKPINKWRFLPHLSPETPLLALLNYGKMTSDIEGAKKHPLSSYGEWWPVYASYRELGLDVDEMPDPFAEKAKALLPALAEFRKYVEAGGCFESRVSLAEAFCVSEDGRRLVEEFGIRYKPFPRAFFYGPVQNVPGIGEKTYQALSSFGIKTQFDLASASDAELARVPGVGAKSIQGMRAYLRANRWSVPGTGEVPE